MSSFKKGRLIGCDSFFDPNNPIVLDSNDQVILEVKICVEDQNQTLKLDLSVNERVSITEVQLGGSDSVFVDPTASVIFTLCKNNLPIQETTIQSSFTNTTDIELLGGTLNL
ncbi:hypothetical protein [Chengkuizengella axinellae]|uniref:Uncharacterized protein n=1 Tax=Chengkuizengella axinellae TaxID=3064388 RepID=A0ABT9J1M8_9BACL|nr:hypothetical protein [Chengkuizengella sp. 2205SS18-9]MDP5275502.1 hypothetical protein [Chengkuizengella sp. 2205SS18-9]